MKFDNIFFHCSPCLSVSLFSQPGKWRLYGDRNVQAEQPRSNYKLMHWLSLSEHGESHTSWHDAWHWQCTHYHCTFAWSDIWEIVPFFPFVPCVCALSNAHVAYTVFLAIFPFHALRDIIWRRPDQVNTPIMCSTNELMNLDNNAAVDWRVIIIRLVGDRRRLIHSVHLPMLTHEPAL